MVGGKDTVPACKDFDNIVRKIEIYTGNYNTRHKVENPTMDIQSEEWNKAVWGSGFGVTQAWDGIHLSPTTSMTEDKVPYLTESLFPHL